MTFISMIELISLVKIIRKVAENPSEGKNVKNFNFLIKKSFFF